MSVRSKLFNYKVELSIWNCLSTSLISYCSLDISWADIDLEGQTNFNSSVSDESSRLRIDFEDFYTEFTALAGLLGTFYPYLFTYYFAIDFVFVVLESKLPNIFTLAALGGKLPLSIFFSCGPLLIGYLWICYL